MITLLTDFGLEGPYVPAMKGVILTINPEARIVDITHSIAPQDVDGAAFVLRQAYSWFPKRTIHVVVVDPGVGSQRAILAVEAAGYHFIAPDNGVLKYIFDSHPEAEVFRITNTDVFLKPVSNTFHGRDIFAPVAAHLSKGVSVQSLGESFDGYMKGHVPKPMLDGDRITGEVIYIDGFGNGITNIGKDSLQNRKIKRVSVGKVEIKGISRTYADVAEGEPLTLIGSSDALEISVRNGNAAGVLAFHTEDKVTVIFE